MSRSQQLRRPPPDLPGDDEGCPILHVDMDAFFASVELRTHPELVGTPVIVGGGNRGVVLSATYEARRFGVHSAMPMSQARRRCPQATVLPPTRGIYGEVSAGVMAIFRSVTPVVEPLSLDEAFLDVAGARRRLGRPAVIGASIRAQVHEAYGITCSVGIAPTKFVAKLASTQSKPDGLLVVPRERVLDFLHPLPVAALWGVGERTEDQLRRHGLHTVADVARCPIASLTALLGQAAGTHLHALANGRDERSVVPSVRERSIGAEETFAADLVDVAELRRELLRLCDRTASRVRAAALVGRTVSIKVRYEDFTTITRSRTLRDPSDVTQEIYETARAAFDALLPLPAPVRLVGVRVESLVPADLASRQLVLGESSTGWQQIDRASDALSQRFGTGALRPASLVSGGRERARAHRSVAPATTPIIDPESWAADPG